MNEKDNFALVPRSTGTLEKVEPGAQRILSGMVADTLALVRKKPLRIVLIDDEPSHLEVAQFIIRHFFKDVEVCTFAGPTEALPELEQRDPDLLVTDDMMYGMSGLELLRHLVEKKANYPVIANFQNIEEHSVREYANRGLNVTFLRKPRGGPHSLDH